jgi:hypothetical protein
VAERVGFNRSLTRTVGQFSISIEAWLLQLDKFVIMRARELPGKGAL